MGGTVFKTVVSLLKTGLVGSIPTRPRHARRARFERSSIALPPLGGSAIALTPVLVVIGCASAPPPTPEVPLPRPETERTTEPTPGRLRVAASAARADTVTERERVLSVAYGEATYYADFFDGRLTAGGIVFRNAEMLAAHREYPFGTLLRVTNPANGRVVEVRVVDRLPPPDTEVARRTVVDLSRRAAELLDFIDQGRILVVLEVLEWGDGRVRRSRD